MPEPSGVVELCRRLQPALFGALFLYCGSREIAEELTQETLARVWEHWASVSMMEHPDRWALRVAFNLAKSGFRRRRIANRSQHLLVAPSMFIDADPMSRLVLLRGGGAAAPPTRGGRVALLQRSLGGRDGDGARLRGRNRQVAHEPGDRGAAGAARRGRVRAGGTRCLISTTCSARGRRRSRVRPGRSAPRSRAPQAAAHARIGAVVALAAASATVIGVGVAHRSPHVSVGPTTATSTTATPPTATPSTVPGARDPPVTTHPEAFRGLGRLAYPVGGKVWILDGTGRSPRSIPVAARWRRSGGRTTAPGSRSRRRPARVHRAARARSSSRAPTQRRSRESQSPQHRRTGNGLPRRTCSRSSTRRRRRATARSPSSPRPTSRARCRPRSSRSIRWASSRGRPTAITSSTRRTRAERRSWTSCGMSTRRVARPRAPARRPRCSSVSSRATAVTSATSQPDGRRTAVACSSGSTTRTRARSRWTGSSSHRSVLPGEGERDSR